MKICTFDGCVNRRNAHGLCVAHQGQLARGLELRPVIPKPRLKGRQCIGPECIRLAGNDDLCPARRWQSLNWGFGSMEFLRPGQQRESFESRLKRYVRKQLDGCWIWTGGRYKKGYGCTYDIEAGKTRMVHRMMKERQLGFKLKSYQHLDHRCRIPSCVNPEHLDLVTQIENTKRMLAWNSLLQENNDLKEQLRDLKELYGRLNKGAK